MSKLTNAVTDLKQTDLLLIETMTLLLSAVEAGTQRIIDLTNIAKNSLPGSQEAEAAADQIGEEVAGLASLRNSVQAHLDQIKEALQGSAGVGDQPAAPEPVAPPSQQGDDQGEVNKGL